MPQLMQLFGYTIYFWSNEGFPLEPVHIHVSKQPSANSTKFWVTPDGVFLANNDSNISVKELKKISKALDVYKEDIIDKWQEYFKVEPKFYFANDSKDASDQEEQSEEAGLDPADGR